MAHAALPTFGGCAFRQDEGEDGNGNDEEQRKDEEDDREREIEGEIFYPMPGHERLAAKPRRGAGPEGKDPGPYEEGSGYWGDYRVVRSYKGKAIVGKGTPKCGEPALVSALVHEVPGDPHAHENCAFGSYADICKRDKSEAQKQCTEWCAKLAKDDCSHASVDPYLYEWWTCELRRASREDVKNLGISLDDTPPEQWPTVVPRAICGVIGVCKCSPPPPSDSAKEQSEGNGR